MALNLVRGDTCLNQRHFWIILLAVACIALIGAWLHELWRYKDLEASTSLQLAACKLEKDIDHRLPVGSDDSSVRRFLDDHHIVYAEIDVDPNMLSDTWYVGAIRTIDAQTAFVQLPSGACRTFIQFKFDKDSRLVDYRDHPSCKGTL